MRLEVDWSRTLTVDQVLAGQGIDASASSPRLDPLRAAAARVLARSNDLLQAAVASRRVPIVGWQRDRVDLDGGVRIDGRGMVEALCGASEVLVALCSVGDEVSRFAASALEADPVLGLAAEGLGCAAVGWLSEEVCRREEARAASLGLRVSRPLSPGIDAWPVDAGQRVVFALLDGAPIGVTLTGSWQMVPTKSASFVLGIGDGVTRHDGETCGRCDARRHCAWRVGRGRAAWERDAPAGGRC